MTRVVWPLLALLIALAAATSNPTITWGQAERQLDVTGTWIGGWQAQAGRADSSTLVLTQEALRVTGTIQAGNGERTFGTAPQPIQDGELSGRRFTFKAVGADRGVFQADFRVAKDGTEISGWGRHTGPGYDGNVWFTYTRAK